jgi:predicted secreted protein
MYFALLGALRAAPTDRYMVEIEKQLKLKGAAVVCQSGGDAEKVSELLNERLAELDESFYLSQPAIQGFASFGLSYTICVSVNKK